MPAPMRRTTHPAMPLALTLACSMWALGLGAVAMVTGSFVALLGAVAFGLAVFGFGLWVLIASAAEGERRR